MERNKSKPKLKGKKLREAKKNFVLSVELYNGEVALLSEKSLEHFVSRHPETWGVTDNSYLYQVDTSTLNADSHYQLEQFPTLLNRGKVMPKTLAIAANNLQDFAMQPLARFNHIGTYNGDATIYVSTGESPMRLIGVLESGPESGQIIRAHPISAEQLDYMTANRRLDPLYTDPGPIGSVEIPVAPLAEPPTPEL